MEFISEAYMEIIEGGKWDKVKSAGTWVKDKVKAGGSATGRGIKKGAKATGRGLNKVTGQAAVGRRKEAIKQAEKGSRFTKLFTGKKDAETIKAAKKGIKKIRAAQIAAGTAAAGGTAAAIAIPVSRRKNKNKK